LIKVAPPLAPVAPVMVTPAAFAAAQAGDRGVGTEPVDPPVDGPAVAATLVLTVVAVAVTAGVKEVLATLVDKTVVKVVAVTRSNDLELVMVPPLEAASVARLFAA